MRDYIIKGLLCGVLLLVGVMSHPARAQDDFSEDERAALARFVTGLTLLDEADSYRMTVFADSSQSTAFQQGEYSTESGSQIQSEAAHLFTDGGASQAVTVRLTVDRTQGAIPIQYTMDAEVRYLEEVIYIQGAYNGASENAPPLPAGWFIYTLDSPYLPALVDLSPETLLVLPSDNPLDDPQILAEYAASVSVSDTPLDDGTPAETIVLTFDRDGLAALFQTSEELRFLGRGLQPLSSAQIGLQIAADGTPMTKVVQLNLNVAGDYGVLVGDESLEGSTFILQVSSFREERYSEVNAVEEVITAPEAE